MPLKKGPPLKIKLFRKRTLKGGAGENNRHKSANFLWQTVYLLREKPLMRNALKVIFEKLLTEHKKEGTLLQYIRSSLNSILLQLVCGKNVLIYRNKSHPILCTLSVGCSPANGSSKIGLDFQCTQ